MSTKRAVPFGAVRRWHQGTVRVVATALAAALIVTSCSSSDSGSASNTAPPSPSTTAAPTTAAPTTIAPTTTPSTTTPPTPTPTTTIPPTTTAPPTTTTAATTTTTTTTSTTAGILESRVVGTSVQGRAITAVRRGQPGGRVVLVIGVIHGDEDAGLAIVDDLERLPVPDDVDLWLVDTMNPDGVANQTRKNANEVDLNRNFPYNWGPIGDPSSWEYAGTGPASEPETLAMVSFISDIKPDIVIWYHQDYFRIAPAQGRDGVIRSRYSELSGVPLLSISGGTYTGVAATWARKSLQGGVAFIVELGATLSDAEAARHAAAVLTVAAENN